MTFIEASQGSRGRHLSDRKQVTALIVVIARRFVQQGSTFVTGCRWSVSIARSALMHAMRLCSLFLMLLTTKFAFDARILSTPGAPYSVTSNRDLQNNFRLRLRNRSNQEETYTIQLLTPAGASVRWSDTAPTLKPNESKLVPIMITAPLGITAANHGSVNATVKVTDQSGHWREIPIRILGPG